MGLTDVLAEVIAWDANEAIDCCAQMPSSKRGTWHFKARFRGLEDDGWLPRSKADPLPAMEDYSGKYRELQIPKTPNHIRPDAKANGHDADIQRCAGWPWR